MGLKKCKSCNGSGKATYYNENGDKIGASTDPCTECGGEGRLSSGKQPKEI